MAGFFYSCKLPVFFPKIFFTLAEYQTKSKMKKSFLYMALPMTFLAGACGSSGGEGGNATPQVDIEVTEDLTADTETVEQELSIVFPSAVEIITVFENAGMTFNPEVALPTANATEYNTQVERAIGAGFYTADLAYFVINEDAEAVQQYFKAVSDITRAMGIEVTESQDSTISALEEALGDKNKTLDVLESVNAARDAYIEENGMQGLATVTFGAAWVEGMYLAIETNADKNTDRISDRLVEQMFILDNLLLAMEAEEVNSGQYEAFFNDLTSLNAVFKEMDSVKKAGEADFPQLSMNEMKTLATQVQTIRKAHS